MLPYMLIFVSAISLLQPISLYIDQPHYASGWLRTTTSFLHTPFGEAKGLHDRSMEHSRQGSQRFRTQSMYHRSPGPRQPIPTDVAVGIDHHN